MLFRSDDFLEEARAAQPADLPSWPAAAAVPFSALSTAGAPGANTSASASTNANAQPVAVYAGGQPATLDAAAAASAAPEPAHRVPARSQEPVAAPRSLEAMALSAIQHALDAAGGNISVASKQLGISRNTIYRKLRWNQGRPT